MTNFSLPRIDKDPELKQLLLPYSRFKFGKIWKDKHVGHKIGCVDIEDQKLLKKLMEGEKTLYLVGCRSKEWFFSATGIYADDERNRFYFKKLYNFTKSKGFRNTEKLDVCQTGIALLCER